MRRRIGDLLLRLVRWDRPSIFLVFACYLALYWRRMNTSGFFSPAKLLLVLALVAVLQLFVSFITFTAFYGFTPGEVSGIRSVQDLGSLIYANFR